jgi:hypothetical protein
VNQIDREHPEYTARKEMWQTYRDLYAGGEQLKTNAERYLIRRMKEPSEVYSERLRRVFYENYSGSIVDWYAATLFRREPVLLYEGNNDPAKEFYGGFTGNCDQRGTALSDFLRKRLTEALITGSSYILVDFPRTKEVAASRAEEEAKGISRAYLVGCQAEDLINWSLDERGNYEWVVLRTTIELPSDPISGNRGKETRWTYYDKQNFRVYSQPEEDGKKGEIRLADQGLHGLAKLGQTPLFKLEISDGLWLMNKAGLTQIEHFNKSNALAWALTMGLFAMPVIYSDKEWNQMVGESYYIQLGPDDKFGWAEPSGTVYQIAADNLTTLKEEIYRVCFLMIQAGGSTVSSHQSGLSKQRDFAITQEVLRTYGDSIKDLLRRVLHAIEEAREDGLQIDVSGLDEFDIGEFSGELDDAIKLLAMQIESPTLKRQIYKRLAHKYLCDVRQEIKDQIAREIDDSTAKKG